MFDETPKRMFVSCRSCIVMIVGVKTVSGTVAQAFVKSFIPPCKTIKIWK
jgi:hypothetical protein